MSITSTDFVENLSLNGDYSVISGGNGDEYHYEEELGSAVDIDIKLELPRQQSVQLFEDQDEEDDEMDLESWVMMNGGGSGAAECHSLDMDTDAGQPISELKDPLDMDEQLPVHEIESKPELKTILIGSTTTAKSSSNQNGHHTKPKLRKINTAICTKCNTGFPSPFLFEQHMIQAHQDDRPYPCKFCGKPFALLPQVKRHETIHNPNRFKGEPKFPCDICGKRYHLKVSMEGHRKVAHLGYNKSQKKGPVKQHHSTSGVKNPNPYRKPKEIHPCPHCDLTFEMKCLLKNHFTCHTKERPFSCPICQQPFPKKSAVKSHIRKVHHSTTPSGMRRPRPKWQANQPCPCTTCGKIFPTPSQLEYHIRIHTGEKPHVCSTCGQTFRLKQSLNCHINQNHLKDQLASNPLKLFKCRICGRDDFVFFKDLNQHRAISHRQVPFESEKEKSFGCGICGKPYYLREGALICALLGHDPTTLRKAMFKHKCTECPSHFGFHNLAYLRRHWEGEHQDKQLPGQFRKGMYSRNLKADELPTSVIDRVKKQDIMMNGPPPSEVKSEMALYTELDLLPIPEQERFFRSGVHQVVYGYKHTCTICGYRAQDSTNLANHVKRAHERRNVEKKENPDNICTVCGLKMSNPFNLRRHMINVHGPSKRTTMSKIIGGTRRRVGRPRKLGVEDKRIILTEGMETELIVKTEPMEMNEGDGDSNGDYEDEVVIPRKSMFKCRFCTRRFPKIQPMRMHELRMHVKPWSTSKNKKSVEMEKAPVVTVTKEVEERQSTSFHGDDNADNYGKGGNGVVNIGDRAAVQAILNFQSVLVMLTRLVDNDDGDDKKELENELTDEFSQDLINNVGDNEMPLKYILGNKELKIMLHRLDLQEL